ncbi:M28 family peptidase [bacterium]|nr:M28 family peptidase [bacterium]
MHWISRLWIRLFILGAAGAPEQSVAQVPAFDGTRAFRHIEKQCSFGPRFPGSSGHEACLNFLVEELGLSTANVVKQPFQMKDPLTGKVHALANVIATFGSRNDRMVLCAHWDTRPRADHDPVPANRDKPVMGANDGASGVAVLLEIARILKAVPPSRGIDIVLFDGEDSGLDGETESWCQGSRHYAQSLRFGLLPSCAILIDMIGDRNLRIPVEQHSSLYAPDLVEKIWGTAERLGIAAFTREPGGYVVDDHLELLKVGIPAVDIIDFEYPFWHTVMDTPDKCSPESLAAVGTVLLHMIYESHSER